MIYKCIPYPEPNFYVDSLLDVYVFLVRADQADEIRRVEDENGEQIGGTEGDDSGVYIALSPEGPLNHADLDAVNRMIKYPHILTAEHWTRIHKLRSKPVPVYITKPATTPYFDGTQEIAKLYHDSSATPAYQESNRLPSRHPAV